MINFSQFNLKYQDLSFYKNNWPFLKEFRYNSNLLLAYQLQNVSYKP
ncbi:hypothetical protein CLV48_11318 [Cecembia rubra]|uniref:Uncharacterized protein n=1 Tax=Cecembia rubra TaxID=1485585 RepID=A0A2P8DW33_9BACT|nr:hypothetical protein CLV48_11318 [Cecembia rubra]